MNNSPETALCFGAVLLAAGRSQRMGQPKMLLPWGGSTVIEHLIGTWGKLGARQIAVVCANDDALLFSELDRVGFPADHRILNPEPERGMFSSILCAAQWPEWQPEVTHWAIVLGDQPHLRPEKLAAIIGFAAAHPDAICQPSWKGHRAHPVILPKMDFLQLAASKAPTLKAYLRDRPLACCPVNDPGLELDLDRPEDYQAALRLAHFDPPKPEAP